MSYTSFDVPVDGPRMPTWLFLAAIFTLGAASSLLAQRLAGGFESRAAEPVMVEHEPEDDADEVRDDGVGMALDGIPPGYLRLNLTEKQLARLQVATAAIQKSTDSISETVFPALRSLAIRRDRELYCILLPEQRRRLEGGQAEFRGVPLMNRDELVAQAGAPDCHGTSLQ